MLVRLPDDFKFGSIYSDWIATSPLMSTADTGDTQHGSESPVADRASQSVGDDVVTLSATLQRRVARRSSATADHFHLPRFQRRRTPRRRVPVVSSIITAANTDTDSGLCIHTIATFARKLPSTQKTDVEKSGRKQKRSQ